MSTISLDVYKEIKSNPQTAFLGINEFNPQSILSWKEVENYLNNPYLYGKQQIYIIDNGETIPLEEKIYPWSTVPKFSSGEIFGHINSGKAFYCANFSKFNNTCNSLSAEVYENIPDIYLDFHVYGGLKKTAESFSIHRDTANNIILQIDGESHWKVYNADFSIEERNLYSDDRLQMLIDYTLKPGDLLYIPAGNYHKCYPLSKRLSISICFNDKEENRFTDTNWYYFNA
jgi:hypothetical protein